jgi:hypothetical protein
LNFENPNFSLFPNPTNQDFTIVFQSTTKQIEIFNSLGESIQKKTLEGQTSQNFQLIENGIYYVQITTDSKTMAKKLIVCR